MAKGKMTAENRANLMDELAEAYQRIQHLDIQPTRNNLAALQLCMDAMEAAWQAIRRWNEEEEARKGGGASAGGNGPENEAETGGETDV